MYYDTTVIISESTSEGLEAKALQVVRSCEEWCWKNSLIVQNNKTVLMNFSTCQENLSYYMKVDNLLLSQSKHFLEVLDFT